MFRSGAFVAPFLFTPSELSCGGHRCQLSPVTGLVAYSFYSYLVPLLAPDHHPSPWGDVTVGWKEHQEDSSPSWPGLPCQACVRAGDYPSSQPLPVPMLTSLFSGWWDHGLLQALKLQVPFLPRPGDNPWFHSVRLLPSWQMWSFSVHHVGSGVREQGGSPQILFKLFLWASSWDL